MIISYTGQKGLKRSSETSGNAGIRQIIGKKTGAVISHRSRFIIKLAS